MVCIFVPSCLTLLGVFWFFFAPTWILPKHFACEDVRIALRKNTYDFARATDLSKARDWEAYSWRHERKPAVLGCIPTLDEIFHEISRVFF